jgi:hypothetical protein
MAPGFYTLELLDLPTDAYLVSAKAAGRDVISDGVQVDAETQIDIYLATPGAIIEGKVANSKDAKIGDAVIALVPDAPLRAAGPFYRSSTSNADGSFELRGIAPGSYRLFAWSELEGAAYRNAEFIKKFEERGTPIRVDKIGRLAVDVKILDESESAQK